jgi:hypothetical protein
MGFFAQRAMYAQLRILGEMWSSGICSAFSEKAGKQTPYRANDSAYFLLFISL